MADETIGAVPEGDRIAVSYPATHRASMDIVEMLIEKRVSSPEGVAAVALTLARLTAGPTEPLTDEEEVGYIQDVLEWSAMYWAGGEVH